MHSLALVNIIWNTRKNGDGDKSKGGGLSLLPYRGPCIDFVYSNSILDLLMSISNHDYHSSLSARVKETRWIAHGLISTRMELLFLFFLRKMNIFILHLYDLLDTIRHVRWDQLELIWHEILRRQHNSIICKALCILVTGNVWANGAADE